jgi:hypothetical protein
LIIYNEFPEFQRVAEEIDSELYFTNLYIYRDKKGSVPHNSNGKIYIDDTDDEGYFGGELVHEVGHTVFDPITPINYINCVYKIMDKLDVDLDKATSLANLASDIISSFWASGNEVLSKWSKRSTEYICKINEIPPNPLLIEILGVMRRLFNANVDAESKFFDFYKEVVQGNYSREEKYVLIAEKLASLMDSDQNNDQGKRNNSSFGNDAIKLDESEAEEVTKQILEKSDSIIEAKSKMRILSKLTDGKISSSIKTKDFYEAKARQVQLSISYPSEVVQRAVKAGSARWRLQQGVKSIDLKRTLVRFGANVPLVTTQTSRVIEGFAGSMESNKPCDLVVSIDCSGSTGFPTGSLMDVADYEVVMFYALVNLAKRLDQRIGLTLWANRIIYTTLPKTFDWKDVEKLKDNILHHWSMGGTMIEYALNQAKMFNDKLFFIFTDGQVDHRKLKPIDNVLFFLIQPYNSDYDKFVESYGTDKVIKIDDIRSLSKIVLTKYIKIFGTRK